MNIKYRIPIFLTAVLMMGTTLLSAQAEAAVDPHGMERILGDTLLWLAAVVIAVTFGVLLYLVNMLMDAQKMRMFQEHGIEVMEKVGLTQQKEPWWKRINKQAWQLVPMEKEKDILFDHEYDGIRELDNSLPPWWVAMFYITIAFGVAYLGYFHVTDYGVDQATEYVQEMERAEEAVQAHLAKQADRVDETNVIALQEPKDLELGQTIFNTYCSACHGMLGEGGVGPNLTDNYSIHGSDITSIFTTIKYGVPEKGMIAWNTQLRPVEMQKVASYIMTLVGTSPPNPKEPQGEEFQPGTTEDASTAVEKEQGDQVIGMNN